MTKLKDRHSPETGPKSAVVQATDLRAFLRQHHIPIPVDLPSDDPIHVVLADDDDVDRATIVRALRPLYPDLNIFQSADGLHAGLVVSFCQPRLVIQDLGMPGIDGFKMCRNIRAEKRLRETKILVISGTPAADVESTVLAMGADAFHCKSSDLSLLVAKVSSLLRPDIRPRGVVHAR